LAFHSAKLSSAEQNYPVGEQELLAVVSALRKWRCYLEGAKDGVTIVTDHLPNTFLITKSAEQFSRRQARWQLELSRIGFLFLSCVQSPNGFMKRELLTWPTHSVAAPICYFLWPAHRLPPVHMK
jgi:hypothetical protein